MNDAIACFPNSSLGNASSNVAAPLATASKSRRCGRRSRNLASVPEISRTDILNAVQSLYQDELKPYGRILRKRLLDQDMAAGLASNEAGLAHLRTACEAVKELRIEPAQGGEWIAYLEGRDVDFVDVYSPLDVYSEELWMQARAYFESLCEPECILPGGRFSCAACLIERKLRFALGTFPREGLPHRPTCHLAEEAFGLLQPGNHTLRAVSIYAEG